MNAQTICFAGRLSVGVWRRQLSEWPRLEWWSRPPLFLSAAAATVAALWALTRALTPLRTPIRWRCCWPTGAPGCQDGWVVVDAERPGGNEWENGEKGCGVKEGARCMAGGCIVSAEWGSGALCASQSVAQWVRLSGAGAKDEGQRARTERWGQPAGQRRVKAWGQMWKYVQLCLAFCGRKSLHSDENSKGDAWGSMEVITDLKNNDLSYTICFFLQHFPIYISSLFLVQ